jgi:two-component system NtrC family response regulator
MLRFLQERVIERVGGVKEVPVDIRVVCATHRQVRDLIDEGAFREDLYYRISEITLQVPPLRERHGDAIVIAKAMLKTFAKQLDRGSLAFSDDAVKCIQTYPWPGNVREMINKVKRATIMSEGKKVTAQDLELPNCDDEIGEDLFNLRQVREEAEKKAIRQALESSEYNMSRAAKLLGVTRPTLYSLTDKYNMTVQ